MTLRELAGKAGFLEIFPPPPCLNGKYSISVNAETLEFISRASPKTITALLDLVDALADELSQCKTALQEEIDARYPEQTRKQYPSIQKDYERDTSDIRNADKALKQYREWSV